MSDVLCIYYSFSGNTRRAMKEIADEVGAKFWVDMAATAGGDGCTREWTPCAAPPRR